jgi:hypothetical protein
MDNTNTPKHKQEKERLKEMEGGGRRRGERKQYKDCSTQRV